MPTSAKVAVLTFDAGANDAGVTRILATLRAQGVPGSFFLTGAFVRAFPNSSQAIGATGWPVGNHTDTHPDLTTVPDGTLVAQVSAGQAAVVAATGRDPRPWFRFPYGASSAHDIALVNGMGYAAIGWTVDTAGWKGTSGGMSVAAVLARVVAAERPGMIVLMHVGSNPDDGSTLDADALPQVIARLRADGYAFTTLRALLP